ncbi:SIR2 family protein, partial [Clostridium botulinum]
NPLALAEEVETIYGRPVLEAILKDSIPDSDYIPDDVHDELLSLPWKDIFTTNYDTLLERASENIITTTYNVINCKEDLVNSSSTPRIIKLHGSFPSYRPFIITEEDYRTYPHDFAPFVNTVQQALIENTFCMIGFSCDDPNFLKWIGWVNDHLGGNHTQNIYMISLSGESEAKQ